MDQNLAMLGALAVGAFLVVLFFVFSLRIGALLAFGRRPLDNRRFLSLAAAAFLPGAGCLGSLYFTTMPWMIDNPSVLALAMATLAMASRQAFIYLESVALKPQP